MMIDMNTFTIILSTVCLLILVLEGYAIAMKKKRDKEAARKYQAMEAVLNEKSQEGGRRFDDSYMFVTDQEQGIRLCIDSKEKTLALVMEGNYTELPFANIRSCDIREEADANRITALFVRVETDDGTLDYQFASEPRKRGSYVEKLVRQSAEQMVMAIRKNIS
jgi:protein involved in temperature-dependent protein secretion